ncbi:MAG: hypothetical protein RIF41_19995 [Polyangiaceae bacterium]
MDDEHHGHDDEAGLCTGTALCLCRCPACSVGARLQLLARLQAIEAVVEEQLQPGELARVRESVRARVRAMLGHVDTLH